MTPAAIRAVVEDRIIYCDPKTARAVGLPLEGLMRRLVESFERIQSKRTTWPIEFCEAL